jgi:GR25 family glycosyltransferase involved in LPS biosynthesis
MDAFAVEENNLELSEQERLDRVDPRVRGLSEVRINSIVDPAGDAPGFKSDGELGCALSHAHLLSAFISNSSSSAAEHALILEDDVGLVLKDHAAKTKSSGEQDVAAWQERARRALKNPPPDWEMLYLGWCMEQCEAVELLTEGVLSAHYPLCTHAYAVTRTGAQKLLDHLLDSPKALDHSYASLIRKRRIRAYKLSPLFEQQMRFKSTITPGLTGKAVSRHFNAVYCRHQVAFEKGFADLAKGDLISAHNSFETALAIQPSFTAAKVNKGLADTISQEHHALIDRTFPQMLNVFAMYA